MGRRDSPPDERTTAFHEAGHVVIAAISDWRLAR